MLYYYCFSKNLEVKLHIVILCYIIYKYNLSNINIFQWTGHIYKIAQVTL